MHRFLFALLILLQGCSSDSLQVELGPQPNVVNSELTIVEDGRSYHAPKPVTIEDKGKGLILVFHGSSSNGVQMQLHAQLEKYSEEFVVIYPNAKVENWEEGCRCNKPYRLGIDDIGFVDRLTQSLISSFELDATRVFAAGYSQGGLFAQNVACKLSQTFKGVAVVAANMSKTLFQECSPERVPSVLMVHGQLDDVIPFEGIPSGNFALAPTESVFNLWLGQALLDDSDIVRNSLGSNIKQLSASGPNGVVELVVAVDGRHSWYFQGYNTSKQIISFFDRAAAF